MPDITPTATYRLQLHADFGFAQAAEICPYLAELGISHLYLSPILQAAPDSMHGYDVVDHTRVSDDLGGVDGLHALAATARSHGLGLVVDVVPNHMAFPTPAYLNKVWWEVLRDGRDAEHAHWFDLDWELCDGRIGLPILGSGLDDVLADAQLTVDRHDGAAVLRYFEQVLPLAPGTEDGAIEDVLARQHYVLADWREKDRVLGYRRFFDVDTLVAVRVELPDVFEATHRTLIDLYDEGAIAGFRIDHPDGLADPQGYLDLLNEATGSSWVVVEKILVPGEQLPTAWRTSGTTGYDAITALQAALAPGTGAELDALWTDLGGTPLATTELTSKQDVLRDLLQPEVRRLARRLAEASRSEDHSYGTDEWSKALTVLLAHVDRYRAYLRLDELPDDRSARLINRWVDAAVAARPDMSGPLHRLRGHLCDTTGRRSAVRDLVIRFQQVCGPTMAKGVEDTTFYRFHRFVALNEVGGDPDTLMHPSVTTLHDWATAQQELFPLGMTTLSTHDTKRDEDVRARLLTAGEDVDAWRAVWDLVRTEADRIGVDAPSAYLVFQTVLGAWPIDAERLHGYLAKALREAKQATTWTAPDADYEECVQRLASVCLEDGPIASAINAWVTGLAAAERAVNLSAKLIQLTLPGVPDIYQGTEQTKYALVDPDNRRPVDFRQRHTRLNDLRAGAEPKGLDDEKLWVTSRAVQLRRHDPELFGLVADYRPIVLDTPFAIAFERSSGPAAAITLATRRPVGLARSGGWQGASLTLPHGTWVDDLNGASYQGEVELADVLSDLPVALLRRGTR